MKILFGSDCSECRDSERTIDVMDENISRLKKEITHHMETNTCLEKVKIIQQEKITQLKEDIEILAETLLRDGEISDQLHEEIDQLKEELKKEREVIDKYADYPRLYLKDSDRFLLLERIALSSLMFGRQVFLFFLYLNFCSYF